MLLVRFQTGTSPPAVGLWLEDSGQVVPIEGIASLASLWSLRLHEIRERLASAASAKRFLALDELHLLAPIDGRTEVWASGVTYEISREARVEESLRSADVYAQVYEAERPELFFKSLPWKVSGPGTPIAIREDSGLDVPEPELALVVNRFGEVVGYSICNDVSSRSIEGENPLYLPQAKIYLGGCALGPAIRPVFELPDPYALSIELVIERAGKPAWQGATSTAKLRRSIDDLVGYLFRSDSHMDGAVLSTGTCLVPEAPFSLEPDDVVHITITGVGTLSNPVVRGRAAMEAAAGAFPQGGGTQLGTATATSGTSGSKS